MIAHRDGVGTGADDNDSGTGVMLELAQELRGPPRERGLAVRLDRRRHHRRPGGDRASPSTGRRAARIVAAIVLDSVAAPDGTPLRILDAPDTPRGTSPTLYAAARRAVLR